MNVVERMFRQRLEPKTVPTAVIFLIVTLVALSMTKNAESRVD
jgi:hypothetical protein